MRTFTRNWAELLMGLGIAAAGILICVEAAGVQVSPMYAKVGPAAFLWLSGALLIVCGATVSFNYAKVPSVRSELQGPLVMLAGLAIFTTLLETFGFVAAATLLFVITAWGLGSRRIIRDLLIGLAVCVAAYFLFAVGLGLRLPIGTVFT